MRFITDEQWNRIPERLKTERMTPTKGRACFACALYDDGGAIMLYEHRDFEIIPVRITTGDPAKDQVIVQILSDLCSMTPGQRRQWREICEQGLADDPKARLFVYKAVEIANKYMAKTS